MAKSLRVSQKGFQKPTLEPAELQNSAVLDYNPKNKINTRDSMWI